MDYLADALEALRLVESHATQARRELAAAEAMVEEGQALIVEKRAALAAQLDLVAAKELVYERRKAREADALG